MERERWQFDTYTATYTEDTIRVNMAVSMSRAANDLRICRGIERCITGFILDMIY